VLANVLHDSLPELSAFDPLAPPELRRSSRGWWSGIATGASSRPAMSRWRCARC
jgi:hypothetical protein